MVTNFKWIIMMIIHILNSFCICNFFEVQTKYTVLSFENVALKSYLVFDDLSGKSNTVIFIVLSDLSMLATFKQSWELWVWVLRSCRDMQLNVSLTVWVHCQLLWRWLPVWAVLIILSSYRVCCEAVFEEIYVGCKTLEGKGILITFIKL